MDYLHVLNVIEPFTNELALQNVAEEAPDYVPPGIKSQQDFVKYLHDNFPKFSTDDVGDVVRIFPSTNDPVNPADPTFATLGTHGPTALNQSAFATGQQQRAYNVYGEFTFSCPTFWLSEAYTRQRKKAYKYQYSVTPAYHYADVPAQFGPFGYMANLSRNFQLTLMRQ